MNQEVIDQERLRNILRDNIDIAIAVCRTWPCAAVIPYGLKASYFNEVASAYETKGYHLSTNNGLHVVIQKKVAETPKSSEPIDYSWQGYERAENQAERRRRKEVEEYGGFANPDIYESMGG